MFPVLFDDQAIIIEPLEREATNGVASLSAGSKVTCWPLLQVVPLRVFKKISELLCEPTVLFSYASQIFPEPSWATEGDVGKLREPVGTCMAVVKLFALT